MFGVWGLGFGVKTNTQFGMNSNHEKMLPTPNAKHQTKIKPPHSPSYPLQKLSF